MRIKSLHVIPVLVMLLLTSCVIEEEPVLVIRPTVTISAHIEDQKIIATALINANPDILTAGNIGTTYKYSGELTIHNTVNGDIIDSNSFRGGGLSQFYSVRADTVSHERFIVVVKGTISVYADISNDGDISNDKLLAEGDFYQEAQYIISDMLLPPSE